MGWEENWMFCPVGPLPDFMEFVKTSDEKAGPACYLGFGKRSGKRLGVFHETYLFGKENV